MTDSHRPVRTADHPVHAPTVKSTPARWSDWRTGYSTTAQPASWRSARPPRPPTLTDAERVQVLDICDRVCRERAVPLIAGAGTNDTARSAAALAALRRYRQVRAALTVVPYYSRPGEAGVLEHFRALAREQPRSLARLQHPLPDRAGGELADPGGGSPRSRHRRGQARDRVDRSGHDRDDGRAAAGFSVLGGDDLYISPLLALGADGGILASAHVRTGEFARLVRLWRDGAADEARLLGHQLAAVSQALFAEPNPVVIKAVLHRLGQIPSPAVRLPLLPASQAAAAAAACVAYASSGVTE